MRLKASGDVRPSPQERVEGRPGDDLISDPDVVIDTAFTVLAPASEVWPWVVQLGKKRAGWYLPRRIERFVPAGRRALRRIDQRWQSLAVGDTIPDYGGPGATFTVAQLEPEQHLVHTSTRGPMRMTWSIVLRPIGADGHVTRLLFRVRLAPVRRQWVARTLGGLFDELTIRGLAAGLTERLRDELTSGAARHPPR